MECMWLPLASFPLPAGWIITMMARARGVILDYWWKSNLNECLSKKMEEIEISDTVQQYLPWTAYTWPIM